MRINQTPTHPDANATEAREGLEASQVPAIGRNRIGRTTTPSWRISIRAYGRTVGFENVGATKNSHAAEATTAAPLTNPRGRVASASNVDMRPAEPETIARYETKTLASFIEREWFNRSSAAVKRSGRSAANPPQGFRRGYVGRRQVAKVAHTLFFEGEVHGRRSRTRMRGFIRLQRLTIRRGGELRNSLSADLHVVPGACPGVRTAIQKEIDSHRFASPSDPNSIDDGGFVSPSTRGLYGVPVESALGLGSENSNVGNASASLDHHVECDLRLGLALEEMVRDAKWRAADWLWSGDGFVRKQIACWHRGTTQHD